MTDDDALMLRLQEGDASAFEELVQRHQAPLLGFFRRNVRDLQAAEDLTQDVLVKVFAQAWDYLPRGCFRAWMYRIARNLLIDSVRRRSHDALVHAVGDAAGDGESRMARLAGDILSPHRTADVREVACMVDECLETLPEEQRLTFVLHHYSGLALPEVADVLETSVPTCKSRLRLAREKLRDFLERRGIAAEDADDEP